jgi:hypothetical protein
MDCWEGCQVAGFGKRLEQVLYIIWLALQIPFTALLIYLVFFMLGWV